MKKKEFEGIDSIRMVLTRSTEKKKNYRISLPGEDKDYPGDYSGGSATFINAADAPGRGLDDDLSQKERAS